MAAAAVVLTVEREGVLIHYGACWDHVAYVADRARRDIDHIDARHRAGEPIRARGEIICEVDPQPAGYVPERLPDDAFDITRGPDPRALQRVRQWLSDELHRDPSDETQRRDERDRSQ